MVMELFPSSTSSVSTGDEIPLEPAASTRMAASFSVSLPLITAPSPSSCGSQVIVPPPAEQLAVCVGSWSAYIYAHPPVLSSRGPSSSAAVPGASSPEAASSGSAFSGSASSDTSPTGGSSSDASSPGAPLSGSASTDAPPSGASSSGSASIRSPAAGTSFASAASSAHTAAGSIPRHRARAVMMLKTFCFIRWSSYPAYRRNSLPHGGVGKRHASFPKNVRCR